MTERKQGKPLERIFEQALSPFEKFIKWESASGLMLMAATVLALVLANSALAHAFHEAWETPFRIGMGEWALEKSIHHWINDGLMALFFFLVGLEIKSEFLAGSLSTPRQAALPIVAALGGMVVPALIYFAINPSGDYATGWGIPMATDIAFAIGVLTLLGPRVPKALVMFLVALAIVDDLGAVVVIALFYTADLDMQALWAAASVLGVLALLNAGNIRKPLPYAILGGLLWYAVLKSGVHATVAGVLTALMIPASSRFTQEAFSRHVRELMDRFDTASCGPSARLLACRNQTHMLETLQEGLHAMQPPLVRLEHFFALPVAFLIIPLFALANAGVSLDAEALAHTFSHPAAIGIMLGLVVGKPLGITLFTWLSVKTGLTRLPAGVGMGHVFGAGLVAGIGFTMSIFIAELSFGGDPAILELAKAGILSASLIAALLGAFWFSRMPRPLDAATGNVHD
ncbi:MAG: Na+/H+ antiporter NhaA [Halothiobacillaceae bacterium]|nr:MAG: Na+/H+ antiporter NhaA [Halothiobacillaceae bacterium]